MDEKWQHWGENGLNQGNEAIWPIIAVVHSRVNLCCSCKQKASCFDKVEITPHLDRVTQLVMEWGRCLEYGVNAWMIEWRLKIFYMFMEDGVGKWLDGLMDRCKHLWIIVVMNGWMWSVTSIWYGYIFWRFVGWCVFTSGLKCLLSLFVMLSILELVGQDAWFFYPTQSSTRMKGFLFDN